jgi:cell division inhibitor SepF
MTAWKKALVYLGLGPDEEYDDYGREHHEPEPRRPSGSGARPEPRRPEPVRSGPQIPARPEPRQPSTVRTIRPVPANPPAPTVNEGVVAVRPIESSAVKPLVAATARPTAIAPRSFNDAQEVADRFKAHQPVIVNLQGVDRDLSRRIIDFASGLCYGLGGQMEKVANHVYMLTPSNVEVSPEERQRLEARGYTD